jgi:hypothetical protein
MFRLAAITCAATVILAGCQVPAPPQAAPTPAPRSAVKADLWLGRWEGAEGAYLQITKAGEKYAIEIRFHDKTNVYDGTPFSDGIAFTRNGQTETIHAGTGEQTGMKWLAGKRNCLVIRYGEGYCRD